MQYYSVILAAGNSIRFGSEKILYKIGNKSVIYLSTEVFYNDNDCKKIVIVIRENLKEQIKNELMQFSDKIEYVIGSDTRHKSFLNGLKSCKNSKYVFIHDGARPFLNKNLIDRIKNEFEHNFELDSIIPVLDIYDSLLDISNFSYLKRENIKIIQTPQVFKTKLLFDISNKDIFNDINYNDEFSWVKDNNSNFKFKFVNGDIENIKLTTQYKKDN